MWLVVRIKRLSSESKHVALEVNEKVKFRDVLDRVLGIKDDSIIEEAKSYVYRLHV